MTELFKTFKRVKTERVDVATITEDNIHLIAKDIGGTVDYSGGEPVLLDANKPDFKWRLGWQVSLFAGGLKNQNGFNRDGDWTEVEE